VVWLFRLRPSVLPPAVTQFIPFDVVADAKEPATGADGSLPRVLSDKRPLPDAFDAAALESERNTYYWCVCVWGEGLGWLCWEGDLRLRLMKWIGGLVASSLTAGGGVVRSPLTVVLVMFSFITPDRGLVMLSYITPDKWCGDACHVWQVLPEHPQPVLAGVGRAGQGLGRWPHHRHAPLRHTQGLGRY
jgi:hypothetical protein